MHIEYPKTSKKKTLFFEIYVNKNKQKTKKKIRSNIIILYETQNTIAHRM